MQFRRVLHIQKVVSYGYLLALIFTTTSWAEWETLCQKRKCVLQSEVINQANQKTLARLVLRRLTDADTNTIGSGKTGQMFGVVFLPLGVHIPTGITITVKEGLELKAQLLDCTSTYGCRAVFLPEQSILSEMGKQTAITLSAVFTQSGKQVNFAFVMEGFAQHLETFHGPKP